MAGSRARYDGIADWYVGFTEEWDPAPVAPLPTDLAGQRVVDLACGYGVASRYLAGLGALVTAVDISSELLSVARARDEEEGAGVSYLLGDVGTPDWWDGIPFDGAISNMALMDVDDLEGALRAAAAILKPGGWFSFALFHPCYPGGSEGSASGLPSWPPDAGYAAEGWWSDGRAGIRGKVGATHRMLSTYLNAVVHAGFDFLTFTEPAAPVPVQFGALCRLSR